MAERTEGVQFILEVARSFVLTRLEFVLVSRLAGCNFIWGGGGGNITRCEYGYVSPIWVGFGVFGSKIL